MNTLGKATSNLAASSSKEPAFLGTGWGFPPQFHNASRSVRMVSGVADINESLRILLSTTITERLLQPTYGCDLAQYVFEPLNLSLKTYIEDLIRTAILYHEPRIKLEKLTLTDEPLEGRLIIELDYMVRSTNTRFNLVFPYYKREATGEL